MCFGWIFGGGLGGGLGIIIGWCMCEVVILLGIVGEDVLFLLLFEDLFFILFFCKKYKKIVLKCKLVCR